MRAGRRLFSVGTPGLRNFNNFPIARETKLANNITVLSLNNGSPLATVGLWVKTGSRYESSEQAGAAHFLEHMFFKGTKKRNTVGLELEVEKIGAHVNAYTSRETSAYFSDCFVKDAPQMVELLADCIQNAQLTEDRIEIERHVILQELESVEGVNEEVVYDYLHYTAFRDQTLGRPILGTRDNINAIQKPMLENFLKSHYTGDRMVFVGVGDLDHDQLASTVQKSFSSVLPTSPEPISAAPAIFTGSDYRHRLDEMPDVCFAYAFPYLGVKDPHFHAFGVLGSMIGQFQYGNVHAAYAPSPLVSVVSEQEWAKTLKPVNMAYSDVGLFGVYAVSNPYSLNLLGRHIARHITSYVYDVDPVYFEWAKRAYATDLLSHYKSTGIADLLGVDYLHHERTIHPSEVVARVEAVTIDDVRSAAENTFFDTDFALSAFGNVFELPEYQALRTLTYNKAF
eukprot:TRINITY_DN1862_c0_g1_i1.p1 TRINITY_DN1862_c0_g1~~TRINITY_DN1862_c0_g1_i1.p1  ORF type:complete len:454 (-),score=112.91 TRINITY_DN1862_c0_g1_i1:1042-2403(-)